jgi:exonuclease III
MTMSLIMLMAVWLDALWNSNGYKLYLASVYAPCCGKSKSRLAANMEILNEVEKLVISMMAKGHEVIVSGDLNFIRDDFLDADGGSPEV